jgi:hypothetical protein
VFIVTLILILILFKVDATSNVHPLDFNKRVFVSVVEERSLRKKD